MRVDTLKGAPQESLRFSAVSGEAHALACRTFGITIALLCALAAPALHAQGTDALRKTDLIRLLTGNTMTLPQIVAKVRRDCVSFAPTPRDRQDIAALGGDTTLLRAIDACVRDRVVTPAAAARSTRTPAGSKPAINAQLTAVQADVTVPDSVKAMLAALVQRVGL